MEIESPESLRAVLMEIESPESLRAVLMEIESPESLRGIGSSVYRCPCQNYTEQNYKYNTNVKFWYHVSWAERKDPVVFYPH